MPVNILDVGVSTILGDRREQQDRYIAFEPRQLKSQKDVALFAIFDGHGGTAAVSHIHANLTRHLEDRLSSPSKSPGPTSADFYKIAIQSALIAVDQEISIKNLDGGATVVLALIDTAQSLLITADLGDSHIVLGTHAPHSGSIGQKDDWKITLLSEEHSPDNPAEKKRIEDAGGEVTYTTGIPRIGGVAMSRALGDTEYKVPRVNRLAGHDLSDMPGVQTGVKAGRTVIQNLVSNEAHFTVHRLESEAIIMLASDGVGDAPEAEEDARAIVDMWDDGRDLGVIAKEVTKSAGKVNGADNCTVVVIAVNTGRKGRRESGSGSWDRDALDRKRRTGSGSSRTSRRSSMSSFKESLKDLVRS